MRTIFNVSIKSEDTQSADIAVEMDGKYWDIIADSVVESMNRYPEFRKAMAGVLQNTMNVCKGYS